MHRRHPLGGDANLGGWLKLGERLGELQRDGFGRDVLARNLHIHIADDIGANQVEAGGLESEAPLAAHRHAQEAIDATDLVVARRAAELRIRDAVNLRRHVELEGRHDAAIGTVAHCQIGVFDVFTIRAWLVCRRVELARPAGEVADAYDGPIFKGHRTGYDRGRSSAILAGDLEQHLKVSAEHAQRAFVIGRELAQVGLDVALDEQLVELRNQRLDLGQWNLVGDLGRRVLGAWLGLAFWAGLAPCRAGRNGN